MKDIKPNDIENNIPLATQRGPKNVVEVRGRQFGGKDLAIVAGPCTVESRTQIRDIAEQIKEGGANFIRGGVFKPLTFPYGDPLKKQDSDGKSTFGDYEGATLPYDEMFKRAEERLSYFAEVGREFDLPVVSEILYAETREMMEKYVDVFQVGCRHMFNCDLMKALEDTDKPVMLKRHPGTSLRDLLGVVEHLKARGKDDVVVCERGIVTPYTHDPNARWITDVQAIAALNEFAPTIPVLFDPSHATFKRSYSNPMSRAAVAAGADGLMVEVHNDPENAWIDPLNAIDGKEFAKMVKQVRHIAEVVDRGQ